MNKFFHTTVKVTGFVLNKVAILTVRILQFTVVGMAFFVDWAAPHLNKLDEKLN